MQNVYCLQRSVMYYTPVAGELPPAAAAVKDSFSSLNMTKCAAAAAGSRKELDAGLISAVESTGCAPH